MQEHPDPISTDSAIEAGLAVETGVPQSPDTMPPGTPQSNEVPEVLSNHNVQPGGTPPSPIARTSSANRAAEHASSTKGKEDAQGKHTKEDSGDGEGGREGGAGVAEPVSGETRIAMGHSAEEGEADEKERPGLRGSIGGGIEKMRGKLNGKHNKVRCFSVK